MQLDDREIEHIRQWAARTDSVREIWLFGSRATDHARPDSDIDLAIALMPPSGKHDWALGNYAALGDSWQAELSAILGRHVSLEGIQPDSEEDRMVRSDGILIWQRDRAGECCETAQGESMTSDVIPLAWRRAAVQLSKDQGIPIKEAERRLMEGLKEVIIDEHVRELFPPPPPKRGPKPKFERDKLIMMLVETWRAEGVKEEAAIASVAQTLKMKFYRVEKIYKNEKHPEAYPTTLKKNPGLYFVERLSRLPGLSHLKPETPDEMRRWLKTINLPEWRAILMRRITAVQMEKRPGKK
jgi:predicted nucleotidyltransferase